MPEEVPDPGSCQKKSVRSRTCGDTTFGNNPLLSLSFSRIIALPGGGKQRIESVPTHKAKTMKEGIHPNYREVVFLDTSCDFGFVTRSTVATSETIKWKDGKEYPVYKIEISAESHPFYTGKQKIVDTAGRVDKFKKRYARKSSAKAAG